MKTGYIGFAVTSLFFLLVIGLEIYINGRPETFDWCNGGDYPYSNWYYKYGDFAWNNVDWGEFFWYGNVVYRVAIFRAVVLLLWFKIKG